MGDRSTEPPLLKDKGRRTGSQPVKPGELGKTNLGQPDAKLMSPGSSDLQGHTAEGRAVVDTEYRRSPSTNSQLVPQHGAHWPRGTRPRLQQHEAKVLARMSGGVNLALLTEKGKGNNGPTQTILISKPSQLPKSGSHAAG